VPHVANSPAGRLHRVLSAYADDAVAVTLTRWWEMLQGEFAPDVDKFAFRAETASLARDVDQAIGLLADADEQTNFLRQRKAWSIPIFARGLSDGIVQNGQYLTYKWTEVAPARDPTYSSCSTWS
jgi:hypothetical protein